ELLTRARHAARAGRLVEADEIIDSILRAVPDEAGAWLLRSQIALQFQRFERSLESAARAVQLAPRDGASWDALGGAGKAAGVLERAIHCYQKSLEVRPGQPRCADEPRDRDADGRTRARSDRRLPAGPGYLARPQPRAPQPRQCARSARRIRRG